MKLEFGKYRGLELSDVPEEYLLWLAESRERDAKLYRAEIERRTLALEANDDYVTRIIKTGYRELAKRLHPDVGGSADEFRELQTAFEKLKGLHC